LQQLETEVTKDGNMEEEDWWKLMDGDVFMGEDWRAPWAKKGDGDEDDYEEVSLTTADIGSWSLRGERSIAFLSKLAILFYRCVDV
jgi:hypothetical protein